MRCGGARREEGARPLVDPLVAREHKVTVSQRPRHRVKLVRHSAVPSMEERLLGEALIPLEVERRLGKDGEERRDAEIDGG